MTEREIFSQALEIPDPAERAAFLDRACGGDPARRQRIERLLAEQENLGSYLEVPAAAVDVATAEESGGPEPGVQIGRYKLLEQIGEGGMGTVWVAEQTEPVKRRVALKLIKPGMDSRQVLSRFEAERQALALMDHPNIAKFIDAGMVGEPGASARGGAPPAYAGGSPGRPFFVMEYVKGVPITEYCDNVRLSIQDRLKLFIQVCQAVQHAHQKGVIHRDLKPSNILVCLYDGEPVPKVIDFGLAKAINQPLTEHTLYTAHGLMVGTPLYMSPEQAEFNNLDIDTRSDIYSLGVILYELLTGTTPLEKQQFKDAAFQEILRLIKEVEPPKPSTRLQSSRHRGTHEVGRCAVAPTSNSPTPNDGTRSVPTTSLEVIATQRSLDPAQLTRAVKGDLDWIVMKALEKERARRYETASALGQDLERHLCHEPIEARPPSRIYLLTKLARKHRGLLTTAVTIAVVLVAGIAASSAAAIRALHAEAVALANQQEAQAAAAAERKARQEAQAAAAAEKAALELSNQRAAETEAVLVFLEKSMFSSLRSVSQDGRETTFREAVEAATSSIEAKFQQQPLVEARLRTALGSCLHMMRDLQAAANQFEMALALYTSHLGASHRDTLRVAHWLADDYFNLGRRAEALKLRETTLAWRRSQLGPDDPETLWSMQELATSYGDAGQHAEALALGGEALARRQRTLGPDHPDTLSSMNNVANHYEALGRHDQALKLREQTLQFRTARLGPTHTDVLMSMKNLARSYLAVGRREEARELAEKSLSLYEARFGRGDERTFTAVRVAANCYAAAGRHADALKLWEGTLTVLKTKLPPDHADMVAAHLRMAESLIALGRSDEALPLIDDYLARFTGQLHNPGIAASVARLRLRHFQEISHSAGCRQTAEMWEKLNRTDVDSLYQAATFRAVTAAAIRASDSSEAAAKEADAEADRAMEWLHKAVAAGYSNAAQLAQDQDLGALRSREDFQKLLAELEAGQEQDPR